MLDLQIWRVALGLQSSTLQLGPANLKRVACASDLGAVQIARGPQIPGLWEPKLEFGHSRPQFGPTAELFILKIQSIARKKAVDRNHPADWPNFEPFCVRGGVESGPRYRLVEHATDGDVGFAPLFWGAGGHRDYFSGQLGLPAIGVYSRKPEIAGLEVDQSFSCARVAHFWATPGCVANTAKASQFSAPDRLPRKWPNPLPSNLQRLVDAQGTVCGPQGVGEIVGGAFLAAL